MTQRLFSVRAVLKRVFGRAGADAAASGLYDAAVAQARQPGFYSALGVADTFEGRFEMVVLHVFLVLRALHDSPGGATGRRLGQEVVDLMCADWDATLREMGVGDLSVGRRVRAMAAAFHGRAAAYEAGLSDGALEAAIRRNVYPQGAAPEHLRALARYLCAQTRALAQPRTPGLREGAAAFAALKIP